MLWKTIAEGDSIEDLKLLVADYKLPKGTPVRFEMTLKMPIARTFDLAGAEQLFQATMPEGLTVKDVYSPDDKYEVVVEAEANSPTVLAVVAFVKLHWLALSLLSIGLVFALGFLVSAIRISTPGLERLGWGFLILIALTVAMLGYLAYKGVRIGGIAGG